MRIAALIQFHSDPLLVHNRARLLRELNPGGAVYCAYGGSERLYRLSGPALRALLRPWVDDVFCLRGRTTFWKRFHTDLAVRDWYRAVGHRFEFDAVAVLQWDLLLLAPLAEVYAGVPRGAVGVTALTPLDGVRDQWPWLRYDGWRSQLEELQAHLGREYGDPGEPHASLGPGSLLPRAFLDAYAAVEVLELGHDEVRLPLYAQALGFRVVDNGLHQRWFDPAEERIFNADKRPIEREVVLGELNHSGGRRVFHPYTRPFPLARAGTRSHGVRGLLPDTIERTGSAASRLGALARRPMRAARRLVSRNEGLPWPG